MQNFIRFNIVLSLIFSPALTFAAGAVEVSRTEGLESRTTSTSTTPTGPSVNDSSDKNQSDNSSGQMMSMLTGGMFLSMGYSDISAGHASENGALIAKGIMEVAMGVLSMKQSSASGKAAKASGLTGYSTDGLGAYDSASTDPMSLISAESKAAQNSLNKLTESGIYNPKNDTITAGGKTYNVSDFSSQGAMTKAGMPAGAYAGMMDLAAKAEKKAKEKLEKLGIGTRTATNGFDDAAGGGLGGAAPESYDSQSGATAGLGANPHRIGLDRDPSSLAGMQKNYNGDPIGVAADSIFLMMTRRYKVKESQESFYNDADMALKK